MGLAARKRSKISWRICLFIFVQSVCAVGIITHGSGGVILHSPQNEGVTRRFADNQHQPACPRIQPQPVGGKRQCVADDGQPRKRKQPNTETPYQIQCFSDGIFGKAANVPSNRKPYCPIRWQGRRTATRRMRVWGSCGRTGRRRLRTCRAGGWRK